MDGWMGGWMDEWMNGWMDGWKDGWRMRMIDSFTNQQAIFSEVF